MFLPLWFQKWKFNKDGHLPLFPDGPEHLDASQMAHASEKQFSNEIDTFLQVTLMRVFSD